MPGKKRKVQKKVRQALKPTRKPSQGELSEKDLEKVTGGIISPRDPQSGLPTG
jgi:bacteriocin-like protein